MMQQLSDVHNRKNIAVNDVANVTNYLQSLCPLILSTASRKLWMQKLASSCAFSDKFIQFKFSFTCSQTSLHLFLFCEQSFPKTKVTFSETYLIFLCIVYCSLVDDYVNMFTFLVKFLHFFQRLSFKKLKISGKVKEHFH
jgi:hypothetical protein